MNGIRFLFFIALIFLAGCYGGNREPLAELRKAENGNPYYGGVFHLNELENFRNLFPLSVSEVTSSRITSQVYENLIRFNQEDLTIEPSLAKDWDISDDGLTYTFYLRENVQYHEDPCFGEQKTRKMTAHDVKYNFDKLCEPGPLNKGYWVFQHTVKGAQEYYQSVQEEEPLEGGVPGVTVIDDHTIEIELQEPFGGFLNLLGTSFTYIYPPEAFEKYGRDMRTHAVGTGPFKLKYVMEDEVVILHRNDNYWRTDEYGNQLPYLDAVKFSFIPDQKTEILGFRKGELDMIYQFPVEYRRYIVDANDNLLKGYENFQLQVTPGLSTQYYGFLHPDEIFQDVNLRKAFNYAVNREQLVRYTLKGEGIAGHHGLLPPAFSDVPVEEVEGYHFDPEKALKYMEKAGYPEGEGFPEIKLQLNSGGERNILIAEAVQRMLEDNLNIRIRLDMMPFAQHLENVERGRANFWRSGWIASYPEAEYFLNLFHSVHVPETLDEHAYLNSFRYESAAFDSIFEIALRTVDTEERNRLYMKADQQAMDDAVMMPLFYSQAYRLLQPYVRNFPVNAMEHRDLAVVYFDPEYAKEITEKPLLPKEKTNSH